MSYEMYRQQFEQESFNDIMADQLRRAPWLLCSVVLHVLIIVIIGFFLGDDSNKNKEDEMVMEMDDSNEEEEEIIEEEEEEEEPEEEEQVEDPVVEDQEVDDHDEDDTNEEYEESVGDEDQISDKPFDGVSNNDAIGLGGGAGGGFGGRRGGRKKMRSGRGGRGQKAVDYGLEWLAKHQSPDGSWDADNFEAGKCVDKKCLANSKGGALNDVGVTGLSLLAFLGAGESHKNGSYKSTVKGAYLWLKAQQDAEGCFGPKTDKRYTYSHAIAALAICELYQMVPVPPLKKAAQKGIDYCIQCQNPYKAWRYGEQPADNDTSVTGWFVMALKSAQGAKGLNIPDQSMQWALSWIEEMTDEETGRTGYIERGSLPVREEGLVDAFPGTESESLTAVGILSRVFAGQNPAEHHMIKLGGTLLEKKLPQWDTSKGSIDMYYWYYGTLAMFQIGGPSWNSWNSAMEKAIVGTQRKDGGFKGSWDPIGAWGKEGGRVYSTAMLTLCLEVYYRYGRVFGTK
jgi:hypothetical protein